MTPRCLRDGDRVVVLAADRAHPGTVICRPSTSALRTRWVSIRFDDGLFVPVWDDNVHPVRDAAQVKPGDGLSIWDAVAERPCVCWHYASEHAGCLLDSECGCLLFRNRHVTPPAGTGAAQ